MLCVWFWFLENSLSSLPRGIFLSITLFVFFFIVIIFITILLFMEFYGLIFIFFLDKFYGLI